MIVCYSYMCPWEMAQQRATPTTTITATIRMVTTDVEIAMLTALENSSPLAPPLSDTGGVADDWTGECVGVGVQESREDGEGAGHDGKGVGHAVRDGSTSAVGASVVDGSTSAVGASVRDGSTSAVGESVETHTSIQL